MGTNRDVLLSLCSELLNPFWGSVETTQGKDFPESCAAGQGCGPAPPLNLHETPKTHPEDQPHAERRLELRPALVSDSGPGLSSGEVGWAGADQEEWVKITFCFCWPQLEARPVTVPHGDGMPSPSEHKQPWTALHRWPALAVKLGISLPPTLPDTGVASPGGPGDKDSRGCTLHLPRQPPGTPVRERDIHVEKLRDRAASMREGRRKPGSQEAQVSLLGSPIGLPVQRFSLAAA